MNQGGEGLAGLESSFEKVEAERPTIDDRWEGNP